MLAGRAQQPGRGSWQDREVAGARGCRHGSYCGRVVSVVLLSAALLREAPGLRAQCVASTIGLVVLRLPEMTLSANRDEDHFRFYSLAEIGGINALAQKGPP